MVKNIRRVPLEHHVCAVNVCEMAMSLTSEGKSEIAASHTAGVNDARRAEDRNKRPLASQSRRIS